MIKFKVFMGAPVVDRQIDLHLLMQLVLEELFLDEEPHLTALSTMQVFKLLHTRARQVS